MVVVDHPASAAALARAAKAAERRAQVSPLRTDPCNLRVLFRPPQRETVLERLNGQIPCTRTTHVAAPAECE